MTVREFPWRSPTAILPGMEAEYRVLVWSRGLEFGPVVTAEGCDWDGAQAAADRAAGVYGPHGYTIAVQRREPGRWQSVEVRAKMPEGVR